MKAIQAAGATSLNDVLDQLNLLRTGEGGNQPSPTTAPAPKKKARTKQSAKTPEKVEAKAEPVQPGQSAPAEGLPGLWAAMLGSLGGFTRSYFAEAFPVSLEDGVFTVGFPEAMAPQRELADTKETNDKFIEALAANGQSVRRIVYAIAEPPEGWSAPALAVEAPEVNEEAAESPGPLPPKGPIDMEEFKDDPLIHKALEVFKGRIVDVKP